MTQEDKQLLADISARLPYGVKISTHDGSQTMVGIICTNGGGKVYTSNMLYNISQVKPYLRPMSSMTEEERDEYHSIQSDIWKPCGTQYYDNWHSIDWLNAHHFDFRNLIERGLAISTEEYNPYKE